MYDERQCNQPNNSMTKKNVIGRMAKQPSMTPLSFQVNAREN